MIKQTQTNTIQFHPMKQLIYCIIFCMISATSYAQFTDTLELNNYIRDTIKDRRPNKVTAQQIQKGMLGIVKFIPSTTTPSLPKRIFKIYSRDYNDDTIPYTLIGWNVEYVADAEYAPTLVSTIDIEITLLPGTPAGTIVTAIFNGNPIYTLTVTGTLDNEAYVIGTVKINQDIKYADMFYIKGCAETINTAGQVSTINTAYRIMDSFTNPPFSLGVSNSSTMLRIGCTYTVDKKQEGSWMF